MVAIKNRMLITLLLCIFLILNSASCATSSDKNESFKPSVNTKDAFTEHLKLKIALWGTSSWGHDQWYRDLCRKFNAEFEFINLDWSDWEKSVRIMAASQEMPDLTAGPLPSNDYFSLVENGLLKPLPDDLSPYPALKKYLSADAVKYFLIDEKLYTIPRAHTRDMDNVIIPYKIAVRKDWMQACGITRDPETYEEFLDMCKTMVEKNASGGKQTIGFTANMITGGGTGGAASDISYLFAHGMGTVGAWEKVNGRWMPGELDVRNTEWIKLMRKYYKNGGIDRDFTFIKGTDGTNKFINGKAFALIAGMNTVGYDELRNNFERLNPGKSASDCIKLLNYPKNNEGKIFIQNDPGIGTGNYFSASITDAKMDRLLRIVDYFLTDEGLRFARMGIEGRDYRMIRENVEWLTPLNKNTGKHMTINELYPTSQIQTIVTWLGDYSKIDPSVPKEVRDEFIHSDNYLEENATKHERNLRVDLMNTPAKSRWNYINAYYDGVAGIIVGSEDVDAMFKKLVDDLLENGGNEAIKEVNEALKKVDKEIQ